MKLDALKAAQLAEHRAALAFVLGEITDRVVCTACRNVIVGSGQQSHRDDCWIAAGYAGTMTDVPPVRLKTERPQRNTKTRRRKSKTKHQKAELARERSLIQHRVGGRFAANPVDNLAAANSAAGTIGLPSGLGGLPVKRGRGRPRKNSPL